MPRKILLLTLLFYIPLVYIPYILTGIGIKNQFPIILLLSFIFAVSIFIVRPIVEFLTIRNNLITKLLLGFFIMLGAVYSCSHSIYLLHISNGGIEIPFAGLPISQIPLVLNQTENTIIASLLLAFWGIISNILTK